MQNSNLKSIDFNSTVENSFSKFFIISIIFISFIWIFSPAIFEGKTLQMNDLDGALHYSMGRDLPEKFYKYKYQNDGFLGKSSITSLNLHTITAMLFNHPWFINLVGLTPIFFLFMMVLMVCRAYQINWLVSIFISYSIATMPAHFTYLSTGHIAKLFLQAYTFMTFYTLAKWLEEGKKLYYFASLFGIAMMNNTGALQTSFYFLLSFPFLVFFIINDYKVNIFHHKAWTKKIRRLLITMTLPIFAFILGFETIQNFIPIGSNNSVNIETTIEKDKGQKWNWATQWSIPWQESFDIISPYFFGRTSNHPEYPYWGKVGQDANWQKTKQGFKNFHITTHYLGLALVLLALLGLIYSREKLKWFFSIFALITLLLSFGRFFPLYSIFYELPFMEQFRNPNKFYHLFYFSISMLAIYGAKSIFEKKSLLKNEKQFQKTIKITWGGVGVIVLALLAVILFSSQIDQHLSNTFNDHRISSSAIGGMFFSLIRFLFVFILLMVPLTLMLYKKYTQTTDNFKNLILFFIFISIIDITIVNKSYLNFVPSKLHEVKGKLESFFVEEMQKKPFRIKFLQRGQAFNYYAYYCNNLIDTESVDILTVRKFPEDIQTFYQRTGNDLKVFNMMNVGYFFSEVPANVPNTLSTSFDWINGRTVYLYQNQTAYPRVYFSDSFVVRTNVEEIFQSIGSASINNQRQIVLNTHYDFLEEMGMKNQDQITNPDMQNINIPIRYLSYKASKMELELELPRNGLLILANKYDPHWILKSKDKNGKTIKKIKPIQANYLFNAFPVSDETKNITIKYEKNNYYSVLSFISILFWFICLGSIFKQTMIHYIEPVENSKLIDNNK